MRWDLLEDAAKWAAENPEHFDMGTFAEFDQEDWEDPLKEDGTPACGTVACLAGTVVWMERPKVFSSYLLTYDYISIEQQALEILNTSEDDGSMEIARELFWSYDVIDHTNVVEAVRVAKEGGLETFRNWKLFAIGSCLIAEDLLH